MQGHRKMASGLSTFAAGEMLGKDVLIWAWSFLPIAPMPEHIASQIITGLAFLAFYMTKERP